MLFNCKDDVYNGILGILKTALDVSPDSVLGRSSIIDDLGADSLDIVDIVSSTEKRFKISFTERELENVKTVEDLCNLVSNKI